MSNELRCPFCDSDQIQKQQNEEQTQAPYGGVVKYHEEVLICSNCQSNFADEKRSDALFLEAYNKSQKDSVVKILTYLTEKGYSFAGVERALNLPQRTLSRWKMEGDLSSIGLSLLKMMRTYPWLIDVAEKKYDENYAKVVLIQHACETFNDLSSSYGYCFNAGRSLPTVAGVTFNLDFTKKDTPEIKGMAQISSYTIGAV